MFLKPFKLTVSNKIALLASAYFAGIGISISYVSSQAYLLSKTTPWHVLSTMLIGSLVFTLFLQLNSRTTGRFIKKAIFMTLIVIAMLGMIVQQYNQSMLAGYVWLLVTIFYMAASRWIMFELNLRYINPQQRKSFFLYVTTATNLGVLSAMLGLMYWPMSSITLTVYATILPLVFLLLIMIGYFSRSDVIEIGYTNIEPDKALTHHVGLNRTLLLTLFYFLIVIGCIKYFADYFIKFTLKAQLVDYSSIQDVLINAMLWGTILVIITSFGIGKWLKSRSLAPAWLYILHFSILLCFIAICYFVGGILTIILFEVFRRLSEHLFFHQGNQITESAFIGQARQKLRSISDSAYYVLAASITIAALFYIQQLEVNLILNILMALMLLLYCLGIIASLTYVKNVSKQTVLNLNSENKSISIQAAQSLTLLRKPELYLLVVDKLKKNPKHLLKKYLLLALGHVKNDQATLHLVESFNTDNEEIQLAIIDALQFSQTDSGMNFIQKVMLGDIKATTLRVREKATAIIAKTSKQDLIPILLKQVESSDDRIKADALLTLTAFKSPNLSSIFERYSTHPSPRVWANALQGMALYPSSQSTYIQKLTEALNSNEIEIKRSALYVIGKKRDLRFRDQLITIFHSKTKSIDVEILLAWSMIQLDCQEGYQLFGELLISEANKKADTLHFFTQLNRIERFELLVYIATDNGLSRDRVDKLIKVFKTSQLNLHEEINYLYYLRYK